MLRSFYIAGTGMMTQRQRMDVVINNLTNADTTGYKKDLVVTRSFDDLLLHKLNEQDTSDGNMTTLQDSVVRRTGTGTYDLNRPAWTGGQNTGLYTDELVIDFTQGPMQTSDMETDLALAGEGFFTIQTPEGVRYTRAGNFQVDSNGTLLTQEGNYVLGTNGGMINVGTRGFDVRPDGTIYVGEQQVAQLQISNFADPTVLRKAGSNLFYPYTGEGPTTVENPNVQQYMLEGSNLDIGREMSEMLLTNRVYESSQRMLRMVDESLEKTVNQIAQF